MYSENQIPNLRPADQKNLKCQPTALLSPNGDFYMSSQDSERIMNPDCFSEEVMQFLRDEKSYLRNIFVQEQYDCIVEVGCHAGHNSSWLSELCTHYIGVDINEAAISHANQKRRIAGKVEFFCEPVENLISLLSEGNYPERKVVLFPFNLFGNFIDVERLLKTLDIKGVDLVMSNFNTMSATTLGRYKYYVNCFGKSVIRVYDAEQGVLFKAGQCFQSIAFDSNYLTKIIHEVSSYHGILMPFSIYGDLFILTK
jgi:hypothetical protein